VVAQIAQQVPVMPAETEQAVRLNGAVQAVAGTTLGLGLLPRLSALVLAGTLVPTTLAGHRYWEIEDPELRAEQRVHFLKNVTMIGGLMIAACDTAGSPSLAWRRKKASRATNRYLADLQQLLGDLVSAANDQIPDHLQLPDAVRGVSDPVREAARTAPAQTANLAHAVADHITHALGP
jgi:uncharacterized membrane protein YphA (DoxX/SURF4 family)